MDSGAFQLPAAFDLAATFFFGVTGALTAWTPLAATASGLVASGATFLLRLLAIHCNWKTRSFYPPPGPG